MSLPIVQAAIALSLAAPLPNSPATVEDWPEFGGPRRDGTAAAVDSTFEWGEAGPKVRWRQAIGSGYGGTAVVDGQVFMLDREVGERDLLRVFALEGGEELWRAGYEARGRLSYRGSRTVPTVQGQRVVTSGGFGHVAVFDRETEELDWLVDLQRDYGGNLPMFGYSAAPLVYDGLVIAAALGDETGLVAFELESGAELWQTPGLGHSHSTPVVLELLGKQQILFLSTTQPASGSDVAAPTTITSLDPDSGEQLWQHELTLTRLPIPAPVRIDSERLFLTGGYRGGSTLLKLAKQDDEYTFEELFHIGRGAQIHKPLLHDGHLYMLANENWNNGRRQSEGGLMCLTLEGDELWRTKDDPYFGRGNAILAGDHLLIQDGFDGTLRVVKASPEAYVQVAEARLFELEEQDGQMWAPMALAGNRLLMRSQAELICVEL